MNQLTRESTNVCRLWAGYGFSFRSDFGAIAIPIDLGQVGGQPLGHRGDHMLATIGRAHGIFGLAVVTGLTVLLVLDVERVHGGLGTPVAL